MLPKIKKRIKSFILEEGGSISKSSVLKIGSVLLLSAVTSSTRMVGQLDPCAPASACAGCAEGGASCGGCGCCGCGGGCGGCCG